MTNLTYFQVIKRAKRLLKRRHLDLNVAVYLLQRRLKWDNTNLLMHYRDSVPQKVQTQYHKDLHQYLLGIPPQYVIGTAPFYGYNFVVNDWVLIPRPETEGLVDWLLKDYPTKKIRVIDIGTGSGVIAITLKLQRPRWDVTATDVSDKALRVAEQNARSHSTAIHFKRCDLFHGVPRHYFDVIISNPPYVAPEEIKYMDKSVIQFEPHLALFAKDHGLEMYKRIASSFGDVLKPNGKLYLEIGFRQGNAVRRLFKSYNPDLRIRIKKDLAGHPRMVRVSKR